MVYAVLFRQLFWAYLENQLIAKTGNSKKGKEEVLVDDGLFAINPAMYAYTAVKNNTFSKSTKQVTFEIASRKQAMMIVSLGIGIQQTSYSSKKVQQVGLDYLQNHKKELDNIVYNLISNE